MDKVFIDTSFWLALLYDEEIYHKQVLAVFKNLKSSDCQIYTSNLVLHETLTRIVTKSSWQNCQKFLKLVDDLKNARRLGEITLDAGVEKDAYSAFVKYHEHKFSFIDASIIAMIKKFKIDTLLTLDAGFRKIKLNTLPYLG